MKQKYGHEYQLGDQSQVGLSVLL